jgi:MoxR-like ATPase
MQQDIKDEIRTLIQAQFPIISVVTHEEWRVLNDLRQVRDALLAARGAAPGAQQCLHPIVRWTITDGLRVWQYDANGQPSPLRMDHLHEHYQRSRDFDRNPVDLLTCLRFPPETPVECFTRDGDRAGSVDLRTAIYVFCDLHTWLDREDRAGRFNHVLVRALRDLSYLFKNAQEPSALVLLSPRSVVPVELDKEIQVIDYPLPTPEEHRARFATRRADYVKRYGDDCVSLSDAEEESLMRALSGLTQDEADSVLNRSLADNGKLQASDVRQVLIQKRQIIRKDGILEYFDTEATLQDVGGLERLIEWLQKRRAGFFGGGVDLGGGVRIPLPVPKGVLLIGVPGGGKSLVAKAVATTWSLPLLRLDIGRIFGGTVGQSEENMRRAIRVAKSLAPAVLWLDEVEKAFPRTSGASDAGTSLRVMNTFLTWMQEKTEPVFVVAAGNDIEQVPTELTRKGRFDEAFYVGLPDLQTRIRIIEIHWRKLGMPALSPALGRQLAEQSRYFTGAEIEQGLKNTLYLMSGDGAPEDLDAATRLAFAAVVPLARRTDREGRSVLRRTLELARSIALPASQRFEDLPPDGEQVNRRGW